MASAKSFRCVDARRYGFRVARCVIQALVLVLALWTTGCHKHTGQGLVLKSQLYPDAVLVGGFTSRFYSIDDQNNLTLLLVDGAVDDPVQVATIRMFWAPRAGRTPIGPAATNATIHYTIFAGANSQEVGIYSGAGFVYPVDKPGYETFAASVWQATLRLTDRTEGFEDLLGGAILEGHLTATRDDAVVSRLLNHLRVLINQRMGYPRWVGGGPGDHQTGRTRLPQVSYQKFL